MTRDTVSVAATAAEAPVPPEGDADAPWTPRARHLVIRGTFDIRRALHHGADAEERVPFPDGPGLDGPGRPGLDRTSASADADLAPERCWR